MQTQLRESICKNIRSKVSRVLVLPRQSSWRLVISRLLLGLCWILLHQVVNIVHVVMGIKNTLESYLISSGLTEKYQEIQLEKLRYLAIVVDSEEALDTSRVVKLLRWLSIIGVKHISLYDFEGVLKRNKEVFLKSLNTSRLWEESHEKATFQDGDTMTLEFLSVSDGKEGTAKAASFLCSKYLKGSNLGRDQKEPIFTESNMEIALRAVGCGGPWPDLLLIYGPARCHLGFPAWRMQYTELLHMGRLKNMKYGSLVKAIKRFTMVNQNYGK